jgi:hypothetical protein
VKRRARAVTVVLALASWPLVSAAQLRVTGERPECVRASALARYGAMAYDHWVHVENGCPATVRCRVSTDVNPAVTEITLEPGQQRDVATFHGSPASVFSATVACEQ